MLNIVFIPRLAGRTIQYNSIYYHYHPCLTNVIAVGWLGCTSLTCGKTNPFIEKALNKGLFFF
jgi:hypothetical protein